MLCDICNEKLIFDGNYGTCTTLIGCPDYPEGHNHDDNCVTRIYCCKNGHSFKLSIRRKCPVCDWKGIESCYCHYGKKLDEWPE